MIIKNLGLIKYSDGLDVMETLHAEVVSNQAHEGYLLVVEHPPTVTMGLRNNTHDLLLSPSQLRIKNIDYCKIDRGGSVTVHEPRQCVVYPIFNLFQYELTVRSYVHALEQSMIQTCYDFGIVSERNNENPGIWIGNDKIGAVGIRIQNKVTKHGIAFNINNSLETFSHIIPCGLKTKGVITLQKALEAKNQHHKLIFEDVSNNLVKNIQKFLFSESK